MHVHIELGMDNITELNIGSIAELRDDTVVIRDVGCGPVGG